MTMTIHGSLFPDGDPEITVEPGKHYPVSIRFDTVSVHFQGAPHEILRHLETEIRAAYDALDKQTEAPDEL